MENLKNHRNIQLIKTNARGKYLVPELNYQTTKTQILMMKPVYLGLSILEMSK